MSLNPNRAIPLYFIPEFSVSSINNAFLDVLTFKRKFGQMIGTLPREPDPATVKLCIELIREEIRELLDAMEAGDLKEIADGGLDAIYVILGAFVSYGIDPEPIWQAIQAANMAKEGGAKSPSGKVLKPPGWTEAPVGQFLYDQTETVHGKTAPVRWNPYNKVVQDHRNGTIDHEWTNRERAARGLPVPWTVEVSQEEVGTEPAY